MMMVAIAITAVLMEILSMAALLCFKLCFQLKIIHHDGTIFCITIDTFHTIIANFVGIQVAPIAFAATDAFLILENAAFLQSHMNHLPAVL